MKRVVDFVKIQKIMLPIVIICMLISVWTVFLPKSLPLGFLTPKNFNVGIDFQGGVSQRITVYSGASIEKIRELSEKAGLGSNVQEVILNERQQKNLFDMIDKNRLPQDNNSTGEVIFRIQGDTLVGAIDNYNKKRGRI